MKRHPALIPLSRDHHNGLVQASRLRRIEERQLFPLIEELVPDGELRTLGLSDRAATCAVRRPPLTGWS
jgi:hypothetical protein